ncbi:dihydropteroate synthase [Periweissella cryptocerci]|nr:dihydropteroate synthase [Periweissella cryptocerci]
MQIKNISAEFINANDFAQKAVGQQIVKNDYVALEISPVNRQLITLLAKFDATIVQQADNVQVLLTRAALPLLQEQVAKIDSSAAKSVQAIIDEYAQIWQAGRFTFDTNKQAIIYGILNTSPDSFYDGDRYTNTLADVVSRAQAMVAAGANVIEIGGQTTRPGFTAIDPSVEIERVVPFIEAVKAAVPNAAIAIDTYKYPVMQAVIAAGVDIINDVNGFTDDSRKLALLANANVGLLTMHSAREKEYRNLTTSMVEFFTENLADLEAAGIARERIALDQGIGYNKAADALEDFAMMRNINELKQFGRPIMTAISNKGFAKTLFNLPREERLPATLIAETIMYLRGGKILRVHEVTETQQLVKLVDTIEAGYWLPEN